MLEESNLKLLKTKNLLAEDHKYLTFLKKVFRHEFRKNGFRRISTSFFENKNFFEEIFKEDLEKNVLLFNVGENSFGLNPLPSIINLKAYIDDERKEELQPVYSYFMDTYYPKKGEKEVIGKGYFGGDVIGENDIIIDIQNLYIITNIFDQIGLKGTYEIKYNFVGTKKEKDKYKEKLKDFLSDKAQILSEYASNKIETNILEIFKSENEDDLILLENAPKIEKSYKKNSKKDFTNLSEYIEILGLEMEKDDYLFGDYEFCDGLIWEINDKETKENLAKGYGYNELSELLGQTKEIPGSGYYVDIFEVIEKLKQKDLKIKNKDYLDLFFVQLGDEAKKVVLPLSIKARQAGIKTAVSLGTPSMKEQMLKAQKSQAKYIVIVGLMEAKKGIFQLRDQETGKQQEIKKEDLIDYIIEKIGKENLDFYNPINDFIISE